VSSQLQYRAAARRRTGKTRVFSMSDPLIKSVNQAPRIRDALNKPDPEKKQKPRQDQKNQRKKDSKRIIDTYA